MHSLFVKKQNIKLISLIVLLMFMTTIFPATALATPPPFEKKSQDPQELEFLRSANSKQFKNPDGTFTAEVYKQPIHYRDAQGKWQEIDNNLQTQDAHDSFAYVNKANKFRTHFGSDAKSVNLARVTLKDKWAQFNPVNAEKAVPKVTKNKINYPNTWKNIDLKYYVFGDSLKEEIVIKDITAPSTYTFELQTQNLTPKLKEDGSIIINDSEGELVFFIPKPFAYDSADLVTNAVKYTMREQDKKTFIDVTIDENWLKDSKREFPVVIDPTIIVQPDPSLGQDCFNSSLYPNDVYAYTTFMHTGYYSYYGTSRAYLRFSLPSLLTGAKINSSQLELYEYISFSGSNPIKLHQVTQNWDQTTLT